LLRKKPFEVVEDTLKYNVAASNGTERKIEIIKKAGIEIDSKSGQIKYKEKLLKLLHLKEIIYLGLIIH
jgi:hypothetical protein